jgi:tripartite-type tricarboxylate transporter receptor subunit TctC
MKIIFKQKIATSLGVVCSAVVLSAALLCVDRPARAQAFPDHEINLIVNYGAGGNTDVASCDHASSYGLDLHHQGF